MENFITWLEAELNTRNWQVSDLAKQAGLHVASVSRLLNGTRKPGPDICTSIARALKLPPEEVFRQAGLLPSKPEIDTQTEELVHLFQQLNEMDRKRLLQTVRAWVEGA